ncbi:MAG: prolyl oligopeptidase family serine peptidase [Flavisolibacter sp.]|nr:prolyl oligopeptidase family serine peptidase [Flavisolibacter sp.]
MNTIANHLAVTRVTMCLVYRKLLRFNIILLLSLILLGKEAMSQGGEEFPVTGRDRIIDPDVRTNWDMLWGDAPSISPDGKYAAWIMYKANKGIMLVISRIDGTWRRELCDPGPGFFASSGRHYISKGFGKWCIVPLGEEPQYLEEFFNLKCDKTGHWVIGQKKSDSNVVVKDLLTNSTRQLEAMEELCLNNTEDWLLGKLSGDSHTLVLHHLQTGKTISYVGVQDYILSNDGRAILVRLNTEKGVKLQYISLPDGRKSLVYASVDSSELLNYTMDEAGNGISFTLRDKKSRHAAEGGYSYWYYRLGDAQARCLVKDGSPGIPANAKLTFQTPRFTRDGRYLLFLLQPDSLAPNEQTKGAVQVDVWGYQDALLYTSQTADYNPAQFFYTAVVPVAGGVVSTLVQERLENLFVEPEQIGGDYAVVAKKMVGDRFWEYKRDSVWLVSFLNGSRKLLPFVKADVLEIDKHGKSVIAFDSYRGRHFYRYNIASGQELNLSANIPDWTLGVENPFFIGWQETEKAVNPVIAARTENGSQLLVYDSYDIWQIDLSGQKKAINLTNGYGRKREIVFRLATPENARISTTGSHLLTAFSERTKANGFYFTTKEDPDSLCMGPFFFAHRRLVLNSWMGDPYGPGMLPLKAARSNAWIVKRESATDAPNLFYTNDFKTFRQLTNLQPQREYNWYTTELVHFRQADGVQNQGVLFKPTNFDSTKKYPVLYYCYEQYSYLLNKFIIADVSEVGKPNIPWFVSRGYLVFTPDHYFRKGSRYKSVLLAAEGAVKELTKRSYVDGSRLGIMGLSQGGGFTNHIITHSKLFAAAFEGCGVSDQVSGALQLMGTGFDGAGSRLSISEPLWGSNMWDQPEQWVTESPVVLAHRVSTPLLISHNKADGAVKFDHALAMFTAMRRLGKKVWLLQYDEGSHGLDGKEALDQTIRMTQYFDHYLKGAPPPRWMTQGIPHGLKGKDRALDLDTTGRQP